MCVNLRSWRICDLAPECSFTSRCDTSLLLHVAVFSPILTPNVNQRPYHHMVVVECYRCLIYRATTIVAFADVAALMAFDLADFVCFDADDVPCSIKQLTKLHTSTCSSVREPRVCNLSSLIFNLPNAMCFLMFSTRIIVLILYVLVFVKLVCFGMDLDSYVRILIHTRFGSKSLLVDLSLPI